MEFPTILLSGIQASILLGILHGINPCSHSWLILSPFAATDTSGKRLITLTCSFLSGITIGCLLLGVTIGSISEIIPHGAVHIVEIITSAILIIIGLVLLLKPQLLHNHNGPCHSHGACNHNHSKKHLSIREKLYALAEQTKFLPISFFLIGLIAMIVPCPTTAVIYGYALNAGNATNATIIFTSYALATSLSVSIAIFSIYKLKNMAQKIKHYGIGPITLRISGLIIMLFAIFNLYTLFFIEGLNTKHQHVRPIMKRFRSAPTMQQPIQTYQQETRKHDQKTFFV